MPSHLSRDQPKQSRMKAVRQRAQKLFEESGRVSGRDQENWLRAEAEIDAEACTCGKPAYVVIKFKGVTYTGEYDALATDYRPGELAGAPVNEVGERDYDHHALQWNAANRQNRQARSTLIFTLPLNALALRANQHAGHIVRQLPCLA